MHSVLLHFLTFSVSPHAMPHTATVEQFTGHQRVTASGLPFSGNSPWWVQQGTPRVIRALQDPALGKDDTTTPFPKLGQSDSLPWQIKKDLEDTVWSGDSQGKANVHRPRVQGPGAAWFLPSSRRSLLISGILWEPSNEVSYFACVQ